MRPVQCGLYIYYLVYMDGGLGRMNDIYKIIKDLNERDKRVAKAQGIEEVRKKVASFIKTEHRKTSSKPVKKVLFQLAEELELT